MKAPNAGLCRYEYPEDRFVFWRWNKALGPNGKDGYWRFDDHRGVLTLELRKGDTRMCYALTQIEMDCARFGWRCLVAQALREIRKTLRHNV